MMLRADVHKQIHNKADDLFFNSHLDLSGSIYINCFYSLQHWLCKPRQILNQTHAATSLPAQTQHSAGRRLLEMCLLHRPTRNASGFIGAHIKAQTEQSQLLPDNKERARLGEPKKHLSLDLKVKVQQPHFNNAKAEWEQKIKGKFCHLKNRSSAVCQVCQFLCSSSFSPPNLKVSQFKTQVIHQHHNQGFF